MVKPLAHNPQTQPITVALKNICREYPAGGGVLRELLQNADDAGASSVRFVLDPKHYPTETLVDKGVEDLQGPALLAYNDSTFSDQDFASLSRIGDSCKQQDGSTTGKFGRGFNAVYNWTDSPSIVSRDRLLILEPHHSWTKNYKPPGGPVYDFVAHAEAGDMKDQMTAFSAVTKEFDRPFQGTIIRIPLRTSEQAQKSDICKREASFEEVAEVMQNFANDFGYTGLLFMKNVSKIRIEIGDKVPILISIGNYEKVREHKARINEAIKRALSGGVSDFTTSFEVEIKSGPAHMEQKFRFAVHHSVQNYPEIESLRAWSRGEAMVPWVAIASEIRTNETEIKSGSLFNVLPSLIRINQPVHIHGYFSMSPDRAQLHGIGDSSVQYPLPGEWNQWLFEGLIPTAWANLLDFLAKQLPNQSAFEVWPKAQEDVNNTLYRIDQKVMQIIDKRNYRVWYTELGYVNLGSGLVAKVEKSPRMRKAFTGAGVPVIYLPDDLKSKVEVTCRVNRLSPQTTCGFLESNQEKLRKVGEDAKQVLLDYVISDPAFRGYGALELFPFEDGIYRAVDNNVAFIHRNDEERHLFELDQKHNIHLQKLSTKTRLFLQNGCSNSSLHPSLRNRSTHDLKEYCQSTHFKPFRSTDDRISVDDTISDFISKVWGWLVVQQYSILDKEIFPLWLIPLSDGTYRKIKPSNVLSNTLYATPGKLGDFLISLARIKHIANKPIIQASKLAPSSIHLLRNAIEKDSNLLIKTSDSLEGFLLWLHEIRKVLDTVTPIERLNLHKLLASQIPLGGDRKSNSKILSGLKIFKSIVWKPVNDQMVLYETWASLEELPAGDKIGLRLPELTPNVGSVTFLDAQSDDTERVLSHFGLAKCPDPPEIVKRFMIPFWRDGSLFGSWTKSGKETVSKSLLRCFYTLDEDSKRQISSLPIIPVQCSNGRKPNRFRMAKELIDPSVENLAELFFADEESFPASWVWKEYDGILISCGLRRALDQDIAMERIRCFAQRSQDIKETSERAQKLLRSTLSWKANLNDSETLTLQGTRWLPATDPKGVRVFKSSRECRGLDAAPLVGCVFPILDFEISPVWSNRLGWNSEIPQTILLEQLKSGIEQKNHMIVNAVLRYIHQKSWSEVLRANLLKLECIVASNLRLVLVQHVFRTGCSKLQPYAYNVEKKFWIEHGSLLKKLGIAEKPTLKDLIRMQDLLPLERELEENQLSVAIETIKLASVFPKNQLSSLKVVDDTRRLRAIEDVTFHDRRLLITTGTFHSTHPEIPKSVIDRLPIEYLSARVKRSELGITDADEFDQHEDRVSAISDALNRYTVESTFKEFLANAEDCKDAKELHWLLDGRSHPKTSTITEELQDFQGPALLVHNDGVFREDDFEGLKRVGRGSKRSDASTIGKFGRGSQTMYHWTDVPMLLSGSWLVILDTERRKPGIKIQISRLKDRYKDQLVPFEGLWGFSLDLDYYPGTIFRFPLRARGSQSKLMETRSSIDFQGAQKYLDSFLEEDGRISLLFLRRIQYMDFSIHGEKDPRWSIRQSAKGETFSGWIECKITKHMKGELDGTFTDRWRVAIEDLENVRSDLQYRHQLTMKDTSCGIAALVPNPLCKQKPIFVSAPIPKYFSSLPLPFRTDLPIHIHATFILASDRASIPVEDSTREDGAEWNKWLLSDALPRSYLNFLGDIGRELLGAPNPYEFWPQTPLAERHLSKSIYTAFWQMLRNESYQVFPLKRQIRLAKLGKRVPPELVNVKDAVFDFFHEFQSTALSSVLESQIPKLVRPPPKLRRELEKIEAETVTPKSLITLFKGDSASKCLKLAVSGNPDIFECLFSIIGPFLVDNLEELNGCRILPLANGNLGILQLSTPPNRARHYYLANAEECELFDFALSILVSPENPGKLFKNSILDSAKFNLTRLDLSDMETILKKRDFENIRPTEEAAAWLTKFWKYCKIADDKTPQLELSTSYLEICNHPIFEATCNGVKSYIAPAKLNDLPAVIEPQSPRQMSLCQKFPGIYIFNACFLPAHLAAREGSLGMRESFIRFIITLSKLANLARVNLAEYIKQHLNTADIKVLQKLLILHICGRTPLTALPELNLLRLLPVWPSVDTLSWMNAAEVLATRHAGLLLPWMKDYNKFINYETFISNTEALKALSVSEIPISTILSAHILPYLPKEVSNLNSHISLLLEIFHLSNWKEFAPQLRQKRLALDQAKKLQIPCELYDHEDAVFTAAFRNDQQGLFLLPRLETMRSFWLDLGLKHRVNGQFEPKDYISCLTRMRNRLETCKDENLLSGILADARIVLQPLTTPSTALDRFSTSNWSSVINQATFPVQTRFENQPSHRQAQMEVCAAGTPLLKLYNIVEFRYLPVCWSQIPTPTFRPTVPTLAHLDSKGKPSTSIVWRHIQYMANQVESMAEDSVRGFLSDLYEAYEYLQDNLGDSRGSFTAYRGERIWFNLESTDPSGIRKADLISSRCGIENLILESFCDTSNLKSVRQGLFQYQRLLKALHCKSIVYPHFEVDKIRETRLIYASLDLLRRGGTLLDLTLESKGGAIKAHKVVMAASSEYFQTRYKSKWGDNDVIDLGIFSHSTLSIVVDFAYKDAFDWTSMQLSKNETDATIADKLDDLLELLEAAEYFVMLNLKAQVEIQILTPAKTFIRESNVLGVRDRASEAKAVELEKYCKEFYEKNREAVDLAIKE